MLRIYLMYIALAIFGWFIGQYLAPLFTGLTEAHWLRAVVSIGIASLAIQQAIKVKNRLGEIQAIEGLSSPERSRLKGIVSTLKAETFIGTLVVFAGNIVIFLTVFASVNEVIPTACIISGFLSVVFFSVVFFIRMHWYLGNQIDTFNANVKNRLEDQAKRSALLEKLTPKG